METLFDDVQETQGNPVLEDLERQLSAVADIERYISAGKAIFTLRSKATSKRYTFKVQKSKPSSRFVGTTYFVSTLYGPDNERSYRFLGIWNPGNDKLHTTRRSELIAGPSVAVNFLFRCLAVKSIPTALEFWHSGRCGRCGRRLTVPASIQNGIGPECASKM